MNKDCAVVRDLLPLYVDEVCSPPSRELVEAHLKTCAECASELQGLRQALPDAALNAEMDGVLRHQEKLFRRRSALAGAIIGGILLLPVLICLIVILASGQGFDWFFIVLASLLLAASVTVVPLAMPENKLCWTLGSFLLTLLLLLGICCRTSGGSWFFVAASACLFGLSVVFLPVVVYREPLKSALGSRKGVMVMTIDTALLYLMFFAIGGQTNSPGYWRAVLSVSLPCLMLPWGLFLLIRYPKAHGLTKAGFCLMWTGVFAFFADWLSALLAGMREPLPAFHPFGWTLATIYGNVMWTILLGCLLLGLILAVVGLVRKGRKKDET